MNEVRNAVAAAHEVQPYAVLLLDTGRIPKTSSGKVRRHACAAQFIAGLLAQPELQRDPLTTIRYAVWEHGAAADRLAQQRSNWTVEDLITELGRKVLSL